MNIIVYLFFNIVACVFTFYFAKNFDFAKAFKDSEIKRIFKLIKKGRF